MSRPGAASTRARPTPLHRRRRHSRRRATVAHAPVVLAVRRGIRCQVHDLVDLLLRDGGLAAMPGPDLRQLRQALLREPDSPRRTVARFTPTCAAILTFATPSAASTSALAPEPPMRRGCDRDQACNASRLTVRHDQSSRWCHHRRSLSENQPIIFGDTPLGAPCSARAACSRPASFRVFCSSVRMRHRGPHSHASVLQRVACQRAHRVRSPSEPVPVPALALAWVRGLAPAPACVSALPAPL